VGFKNRTKLSDAEAKSIADRGIEENAAYIRDEMVKHYALWALKSGREIPVQQLATELRKVVSAVFRAKANIDERECLLALEYITQSFAITIAKKDGQIELEPMEMPDVTGSGGSDVH
jgi:hypothetical protein